MSIAISISPKRIIENGLEKVNLGWDGLNDYEKIAAKTFEEGIENSFEVHPPSLHIDATEEDEDEKDDFIAMQDVLLTFTLNALGDGDNGPEFRFSLKEALTSVTDCYPDDVRLLIANMRRLADYAEWLISISNKPSSL
jgi:hypothetical protein